MGIRWSSLKCCFKGSSQDNLNFTDLTSGGEEQPKTYSWDVREKPVACIIENEEHNQIIRQPKGQQLIIRNCKNCQIYILDWTSSATIDDCVDCIILISTVGGSLFMRDTNSTTLFSASTQLRLRDCNDIHLFSACESDPIIESCQNVQVAPYFLSYDKIEEHFIASKLDNFKATHWGQIYDFTPPSDPSQFNWRKLKEPFDVNRFLPPPTMLNSMMSSLSNSNSVSTTITATSYNMGDNNENYNSEALNHDNNDNDNNESTIMNIFKGFHVGSQSFVPITKDSFNNNSSSSGSSSDVNNYDKGRPTLILFPDCPSNRQVALQFLHQCNLSSSYSSSTFSLLLSTVRSSLDSGEGNVIALLFSHEPSDVVSKLQIGTNNNNIRMTADSQTISQYFTISH